MERSGQQRGLRYTPISLSGDSGLLRYVHRRGRMDGMYNINIEKRRISDLSGDKDIWLIWRHGPDLCPLWLLVGTPSAIRPELAFSRAEHSRPYSDVAKYIFDM